MNEPVVHRLKSKRPWFQRVLDGTKTYEVRFNDRNFQKGDHVQLGWEHRVRGLAMVAFLAGAAAERAEHEYSSITTSSTHYIDGSTGLHHDCEPSHD